MSESLKKLNSDYKEMKKNAKSSAEKQRIKHDYKEMKKLIKNSDKLLKESANDQKKWDKTWGKFDKKFKKMSNK